MKIFKSCVKIFLASIFMATIFSITGNTVFIGEVVTENLISVYCEECPDTTLSESGY